MKIYCRMETGIGKKNIEDRVVVDNSIIAGGVYSADIPKSSPLLLLLRMESVEITLGMLQLMLPQKV